jgi:hypothetical protein
MVSRRHSLVAAITGAFAIIAYAVVARGVSAETRIAPPAPIRHVFVLVLENQGFDSTFKANSRAPYLADTLRLGGAMLPRYYGIGHFSLDNYIAMISGLAPTNETQRDCSRYLDFVETDVASLGQPVGKGCVYPAHVATIANQLEAAGLTWKGYMEDMGANPRRESATCGHPVIGSRDSTQGATPTDQNATKHNPFMYFHSVIDSATCQRNVIALPALEQDLKSVSRTPNFSFISPSLCHDGHDRPCKNGEPGSLESADAFLRHWVPKILASPAFRADGLLIITFDEAWTTDATACCNEQSGPNVTNAGFNGPGGGRVGAVLLSPFIKPGTVSTVAYNHYSMLRSVEDIFGVDHLGYAGQSGLVPFGNDVFTRLPR